MHSTLASALEADACINTFNLIERVCVRARVVNRTWSGRHWHTNTLTMTDISAAHSSDCLRGALACAATPPPLRPSAARPHGPRPSGGGGCEQRRRILLCDVSGCVHVPLWTTPCLVISIGLGARGCLLCQAPALPDVIINCGKHTYIQHEPNAMIRVQFVCVRLH